MDLQEIELDAERYICSGSRKSPVISFCTFYHKNSKFQKKQRITFIFFHSCTVHSDVIHSFITPTNAQLICFKRLKFTLKYITNAPTCFGFD
jgi:hypothetical protein